MTKEYNDYLAHHGVKGQKWGIRRYQNEDGSLINPKGRNYSNNGPEKSEEEKRADAERRKATAKKILGIAAGVTLAGIAAYGIYKGTGKLKNQMINQAKDKADDAFWAKFKADQNYRRDREEVLLAKDRLKRGTTRWGRSDDFAKNLERKEMLTDMRWAKNNRQAIKKFTAEEQHYNSIANNATRANAFVNWFRNKGKIVI